MNTEAALVYFKKKLMLPKDFSGPGLERGLFFGESPFTTIRQKDESYLFLESHYRRLEKSIDFLWGEKISNFKEELNIGIESLREKGDFYVRITFFKTLNNEIDFFIYRLPFEEESKSIKLTQAQTKKSKSIIPSFLKVGNYLTYSLELKECAKDGYNEVFFLNEKNQITETGTSNIFFIKDGVVCTPQLEDGILDGICRHAFLDFLATENIPYKEGNFLIEDFKKASEIFLTNALRGVRVVESFNNKKLEGKISSELNNKFLKYCEK